MLAAFAAVPRLSAVAATAAKLRIDVMFPSTFYCVHADRHVAKGYAGGASCRCAHHGPVTKCHLKSGAAPRKAGFCNNFYPQMFQISPHSCQLDAMASHDDMQHRMG